MLKQKHISLSNKIQLLLRGAGAIRLSGKSTALLGACERVDVFHGVQNGGKRHA
jgi:hypothetical protein